MAKVAGGRFLRISIILFLLVVGATAGGLYFYNAAGVDTQAAQAEDATETAEATDGETSAGVSIGLSGVLPMGRLAIGAAF